MEGRAQSVGKSLESPVFQPHNPETFLESSTTKEWADVLRHLEYLEARDNEYIREQYQGSIQYQEDTLSFYPDIYLYAERNSQLMAIGANSLRNRDRLDTLSPPERMMHAINVYLTFTGMHSMYERQQVLRDVALELEENIEVIETLRRQGDEAYQTRAWEARVLASVYEELSDITGERQYASRAQELNEAIVKDSDIPWHHGYKIHALFTKHDRIFNHELDVEDKDAVFAAQVAFYEDIAQLGSKLYRSVSAEINEVGSMAGSVFEALSVGLMRDKLVRKKHLHDIRVRQAYLREDYMLPIHNPETEEQLKVPNHSYDLVVYYADKPEEFLQRLNIDLKKGNGSQTVRPLPGTICVKGRYNAFSVENFAELVINFAHRQINRYQGIDPTSDQARAFNTVDKRLDVEDILRRFDYRQSLAI